MCQYLGVVSGCAILRQGFDGARLEEEEAIKLVEFLVIKSDSVGC